mmetsp:Transcript_14744/g.33890  ORF Transcript_14744/g.33890 Transcript_14744/m.33890 type:complete len:281 (-) Transcript_14744:86-928(-)
MTTVSPPSSPVSRPTDKPSPSNRTVDRSGSNKRVSAFWYWLKLSTRLVGSSKTQSFRNRSIDRSPVRKYPPLPFAPSTRSMDRRLATSSGARPVVLPPAFFRFSPGPLLGPSGASLVKPRREEGNSSEAATETASRGSTATDGRGDVETTVAATKAPMVFRSHGLRPVALSPVVVAVAVVPFPPPLGVFDAPHPSRVASAHSWRPAPRGRWKQHAHGFGRCGETRGTNDKAPSSVPQRTIHQSRVAVCRFIVLPGRWWWHFCMRSALETARAQGVVRWYC